MKVALYLFLFGLFFVTVYYVNGLFDVNERLAKTYVPKKVQINKRRVKEISEKSEVMRTGFGEDSLESKPSNLSQDADSEVDAAQKFTKRYFNQAGRNYRVFYLKDERMAYLHRMWFDQVRKPSDVIRSDFPSIFSQSGCCFAGEAEFFVVIPGTNIFKKIGYYKFER